VRDRVEIVIARVDDDLGAVRDLTHQRIEDRRSGVELHAIGRDALQRRKVANRRVALHAALHLGGLLERRALGPSREPVRGLNAHPRAAILEQRHAISARR
jgi:hypothetical protein